MLAAFWNCSISFGQLAPTFPLPQTYKDYQVTHLAWDSSLDDTYDIRLRLATDSLLSDALIDTLLASHIDITVALDANDSITLQYPWTEDYFDLSDILQAGGTYHWQLIAYGEDTVSASSQFQIETSLRLLFSSDSTFSVNRGYAFPDSEGVPSEDLVYAFTFDDYAEIRDVQVRLQIQSEWAEHTAYDGVGFGDDNDRLHIITPDGRRIPLITLYGDYGDPLHESTIILDRHSSIPTDSFRLYNSRVSSLFPDSLSFDEDNPRPPATTGILRRFSSEGLSSILDTPIEGQWKIELRTDHYFSEVSDLKIEFFVDSLINLTDIEVSEVGDDEVRLDWETEYSGPFEIWSALNDGAYEMIGTSDESFWVHAPDSIPSDSRIQYKIKSNQVYITRDAVYQTSLSTPNLQVLCPERSLGSLYVGCGVCSNGDAPRLYTGGSKLIRSGDGVITPYDEEFMDLDLASVVSIASYHEFDTSEWFQYTEECIDLVIDRITFDSVRVSWDWPYGGPYAVSVRYQGDYAFDRSVFIGSTQDSHISFKNDQRALADIYIYADAPDPAPGTYRRITYPAYLDFVLGVEDLDIGPIPLTPNPAYSKIEISETYELMSVFDLSGVEHHPPKISRNRYDIGSLKPGVYLVRLSRGGEVSSFKLVKTGR